MKYAWIDGGSGDGPLWLRPAVAGETESEVDPSLLTQGFDNDFYHVVNHTFTVKDSSEISAIIAARESAANDVAQRQSDIADAQETSGLKQYTIAQAETYINNQFDTTALDATDAAVQAATDVEELKTAVRAALVQVRALLINSKNVHLKEVPYILE